MRLYKIQDNLQTIKIKAFHKPTNTKLNAKISCIPIYRRKIVRNYNNNKQWSYSLYSKKLEKKEKKNGTKGCISQLKIAYITIYGKTKNHY